MKITIAYIPEEETEAAAAVAAIRSINPGITARKSERHPPFMHLYLTTRKPKKCCNSNESA